MNIGETSVTLAAADSNVQISQATAVEPAEYDNIAYLELQISAFAWAPVTIEEILFPPDECCSGSDTATCSLENLKFSVVSLDGRWRCSDVRAAKLRFPQARVHEVLAFWQQQRQPTTISSQPPQLQPWKNTNSNICSFEDELPRTNIISCSQPVGQAAMDTANSDNEGLVEVWTASETHPPGIWELAKIHTVKHDTFYFISYLQRNDRTIILENPMIRPASQVATLVTFLASAVMEGKEEQQQQQQHHPSSLVQVVSERIDIPPQASAFLQQSEAWESLTNTIIYRKTLVLRVLVATREDGGASSEKTLAVTIIGDPKSTQMAKSLLDAQIRHGVEATTFQTRRNRRLKLLEGRRSRNENAELVEFAAGDSLVGLVIGKQGDNLSRVAKSWKVEIHVLPDEKGSRRIRIYGADRAKVMKAKAELEHLFCEIPLPENATDFKNWLVTGGPEEALAREHSGWNSLHSVWYDAGANSLIVCGLQRGIDDVCHQLHEEYDRHRQQNF